MRRTYAHYRRASRTPPADVLHACQMTPASLAGVCLSDRGEQGLRGSPTPLRIQSGIAIVLKARGGHEEHHRDAVVSI
jgi:hypothetical protein